MMPLQKFELKVSLATKQQQQTTKAKRKEKKEKEETKMYHQQFRPVSEKIFGHNWAKS